MIPENAKMGWKDFHYLKNGKRWWFDLNSGIFHVISGM
jgi:hypothetical protein